MRKYYKISDVPNLPKAAEFLTSYLRPKGSEDKEKRLRDFHEYLTRLGKNKETTLDGNKIREAFFPKCGRDVFISHAHADEGKALNLKRICEENSISAFVDSSVWLHIDDLFADILPSPGSASRMDILKLASNFYVMLASALVEMLSACNTFVLIDTANAISHGMDGNSTISPWLMLEINTCGILAGLTRTPVLVEATESFKQVKHRVSLDYLEPVTFAEFKARLFKK